MKPLAPSEPSLSESTTPPRLTTRRNLVRGASWTVPVIVVSAAVPAYASSPIACPVVPAASQWSATTTTGTPATKADDYQWYPTTDRWVIFKDNASTTATLTFTSSSPSFAVAPGSTVQGGFTFFWQYGNGASGQSTGGRFDILINNVVVKSLTTRTAAVGTSQATTTQSFSYTVPTGISSIVVTYRFVLSARGGVPASDDIIVSRLGFSGCTIN